MKSILIASTSTIHGMGYLEYLFEPLKIHFTGVKELIFIPYARPEGITHDEYTKVAVSAFNRLSIKVRGLHEFKNPIEALKIAQGIFVGGGNTFVLLNQLYKNKLIEPLREAVIQGTPYLGTSAGSNICGPSIATTNDMPIVYPPSFNALGFVPFNINPHYLNPVVGTKHMGETRETRIAEFHHFNSQPVIGLREGSWIKVNGSEIRLEGPLKARIFEYKKSPYEIDSPSSLGFLK